MNKKEISEIKKLLSPSNCCITRICSCYVDGEKNKKSEMKRTFLGLPEEEMFKYFEIFKKTLSGTVGKNLINLDFPLEQEKYGGTQEFLLKLRDSELKNDELTEEFFDKIISQYSYPENYYIILVHMAYDVPGKGTDGLDMDDASDEVYRFLLCSICPVNLSKAGLCYNESSNAIEDRIRDWVVSMPDLGFVFPVFNDRSTDIHSMLYYSKNANELPYEFISQVFGCEAPMTATTQKETFTNLVEDTLGQNCNLETVISIHEKLGEIMDAQKENPEPVMLQKEEVKQLLEDSGVKEEHLEKFDEHFECASGGEASPLVVSNLINTKRFEIKTPDVQIHVNPSKMNLVETRDIDGRKCFVIPMDADVAVNGIHVHAASGSQASDIDDITEE